MIRACRPAARPVPLVALLLIILAPACVSEPPLSTTTTTEGGAAAPEAALTGLVEHLAAGDYPATSLLIFDDQLALLVSLEGSDAAQTEQMLELGVPAQVRENFWSSFTENFPVFADEELTEMRIGRTERFSVEGRDFATVGVTLETSSGEGEWITRRDAQSRWRVDLFATFGSSFARPFREWMSELGEDDQAERVRAALAAQRASLLAALQRQPFGPLSPATVAEVDALLLEVDR